MTDTRQEQVRLLPSLSHRARVSRLCRRVSVSPCVCVQLRGLDWVLINKEGAQHPPGVPLLRRDILLGP